ncbi:MAG: hypothetical protein ACM31N_07715 [Deltaproteobacteria bacterium]
MPTFEQVHALLQSIGPGYAKSSVGTEYRIIAINDNIVAFPRSGRITIHSDCWGQDLTCAGTRAGGIYNGPYSILDWYRDNS